MTLRERAEKKWPTDKPFDISRPELMCWIRKQEAIKEAEKRAEVLKVLDEIDKYQDDIDTGGWVTILIHKDTLTEIRARYEKPKEQDNG